MEGASALSACPRWRAHPYHLSSCFTCVVPQKTAEYRLVRWLDRVVPKASRRDTLRAPVTVHETCAAPTTRAVGGIYPLHYVGSHAAATSTLTIAPPWLFMHLPSSVAAKAIARCRTAGANGTSTMQRPAPPFIMAHLAGVRTGAWSRRALIRAYGWWHPAADMLIAKQLGWGRTNRTLVLGLSGSRGGRPAGLLSAMGRAVRSQAEFDNLVGNLLFLGRLLRRRVVVPELPCGLFPGSTPGRGYGMRPVAARVASQAQPCAWMPPKPCWSTEYTTELEFERELARPLADEVAPRRRAATNGGASACDAVQRELSDVLAPMLVQAHSTGLGSQRNRVATLARRNRSTALLALPRRLGDLLCDTAPTAALLPIEGPKRRQGHADGNSTQVRQRSHLLDLLTHAPIARVLAGQLASFAERTADGAALLDVESVRQDMPCISALVKAKPGAS